MKVIFRIITRLNTGGPAIQVISLSKKMVKKGYITTVLAGKVPSNEGKYFEDKIDFDCDPDYIQILELQRGINLWKDYKAYKIMKGYMEALHPDIVHTHTSKAGFVGRLAALSIHKDLRPKLVHTFHGNIFEGYFGKAKSWVFKKIEQWLGKKTDVLIVLSNVQKQDLLNKGIGYHGNIRVIKLGFDLSEFLKIKEFEYKGDRPLNIGIIGRLTKIKNHELFFKFIEELNKHIKVYGWVIGSGEREDELKELRNKKLISMSGEWLHHEMPAVVNGMDIVVCSSKNEGTPVSLIEAMAAGRLVVSTLVGGATELIGYYSGDYRGVFLKDPKETAEKVCEVLKDDSYKKLIKKARKYVAKEHDIKRLVNDMDELYKGVL